MNREQRQRANAERLKRARKSALRERESLFKTALARLAPDDGGRERIGFTPEELEERRKQYQKDQEEIEYWLNYLKEVEE